MHKCYVEVSEKNEKMRVYLKPSEMLNIVESHMRIMLTIENFGNITLSRKFSELNDLKDQILEILIIIQKIVYNPIELLCFILNIFKQK